MTTIAPEAVSQDAVIAAIKTVYDPEIPIDIHELGLIYDIALAANGSCRIAMTLTSPSCPSAAELPGAVQRAVASVPGITQAEIDLVWDPPWDPSRMSEDAKLALGFD